MREGDIQGVDEGEGAHEKPWAERKCPKITQKLQCNKVRESPVIRDDKGTDEARGSMP